MSLARAVRITGAGGPEVLVLDDVEVREPGPSEVLVEVRAAGLNRADCLQRKGFYPAPKGAPADVPGLEFAGVVAKVGSACLSAKVGDHVMGIVAGGGMASSLVVHERELVPIPAGMGFTDAAAIPEVFFTAYDAVFVQGGLTMGRSVLIHAVASGVGTAAIQLAKHAGALPIGTTRTESKLARCTDLGLDHGIVVHESKFAERVKSIVPEGVDVILDTVGAAYLGENLDALATGGTIVGIGLMGGAKGTLPLGTLLAKRALLRGSTLRARPLEEKIALAERFRREVLPLFRDGRLRPVVDAVMPIADIRDAHVRLEANETVGKLVMTF